jgi:hypothetical protein
MGYFYLQRTAILWVSFMLVFLLSCIGGGNNEIVNGFGGSGKIARISDLGVDGVNDTMTVDGIKYTTDTAIFIRDGVVIKEQSDFNLGEIVTVEGVLNPDGKTGVAKKIIFDDALEGPVTKEVEDSFIEVLGQRIDIDTDTLFHGFDHLADLKRGNRVEISGFVRKNQNILATSIRLITTSIAYLDIAGYVNNLDTSAKRFHLNNLVIDYSRILGNLGGKSLKNGFYVKVDSIFPLRDEVMTAADIEVLSEGVLKANTVHEISGVINRFSSLADFDVYGLPIVTNAQTLLTRSAGLDGSLDTFGINKAVIVSGKTNATGILVADKLTFISRASKTLITGLIEAIDIENKTVSVLGVTFSLDDSISVVEDQDDYYSSVPVDFRDFIVGDYVSLDAYRSRANEHIILLLRRTAFDLFDLSIEGVVFDSDQALGSIDLIEHRMTTDSTTRYIDVFNNYISKQLFFSALALTDTSLVIHGDQVGEKTVKASRIFMQAGN